MMSVTYVPMGRQCNNIVWGERNNLCARVQAFAKSLLIGVQTFL